jgi:serine/threonine protein kinase/DNA/RNA endonuclease YhcR with UshA esterase domain
MMPVPATRDEFLDLVRKSGVLDGERVSAFAQAMTAAGVSLDQPKALAQRMIREGLITKFQAEQFLQGKWQRFLINGKYKLLEPLGAGGMGAVYLCEHIYMRRHVAVKVLPPDKLKDPSTVERFYREARAVASLDHPNIVRAYDIDREERGREPLHYLVMEYVDGASLQEIVARKGAMTPVRAAHYVKQSAQGLQHAHEAGLVHRDVKPGNLLLDRAGVVKVLDLGLARFFQAGKDNVTERYDEKNAILGTADYLAPEQARGDVVDIRADIYSLGATLYFLLAGKAPFEEGTITQKLLWSQMKAPKPIRELKPDVPVEMAAVLEKMMAKDAKDRYATPQAVVDALAPWTAMPIPPPAPEEMPRRSLAASSPGSQSHAPLVPSTPSPRSVPTDLIRGRTGSGAPLTIKPSAPKTPGPKPAPKTPAPAPANGPRSRPLAPIIRGPAPRSAVRRKADQKSAGMSTGMIFAAAAGGAGLLFVGIFIAWLLKRPAHHVDTTVQAPSAPAAVQPKQLPPPSSPIRPEQAASYLDRRVTVEMTVQNVGKATTTDLYFLNSKANYRAADNFSVTFAKPVLDQMGAKGITNLDQLKKAFENKAVRVTGIVTIYQSKPQIVVENADQIQIVNP